MKIDTLGIQAFIAIADCGGFLKAAKGLHLSQTGVTRRLQNLERFLGLKLIERTTRSVELTAVGHEFLPRARRLLMELSASLAEIVENGNARRGSVSIACVPTAGIQLLPRVIEQYANSFPENRITILDHASAGVAAAVLRREAEFGISIAEAHHPELVSIALLKDKFVFICRDDHPLGSRKTLRWKDLESLRLICAGAESANRFLLDQALDLIKIKLQPYYEVQHSSTALGLVTEGIAAAVVPKLAVQKGANPRIRIIPLTLPEVSRTIVLVSRASAQLSPAAQALYDLIKRRAGTGF
jgi:DNA-binding transcriptional LysR family regulator